jgi:hypothetical protein
MAVATVNLAINGYPSGTDNTQRMQRHYGVATFLGASPSYVKGGLRMNFAQLEPLKVSPQFLLPLWVDVYSVGVSGFDYSWNPLGAAITNIALTTNVVTITANNNLAAGDTVTISGVTTATFLNGQTLTVLAGGLSATAFTANFTHANYGSAGDTGYAKPLLYASGLPFIGNLQILTGAAAQSPLTEFATGALPTSIVGSSTVNADVLYFRGDFVRI